MRTGLLITLLLAFGAVLGSCSRSQPETPRAQGGSPGPVTARGKEDAAEAKGKEGHGATEGGRGQHDEAVTLSAEGQRQAGITVQPVASASVAETLTLNGTVQPIDNRVAHVRPLARGRLLDVLVRLGDQVRPGQSLARIDNIEAGELATQYLAARAEMERLRIQQAATARQVERTRRLVELGAAPPKELEVVEAESQGQLAAIRAQESTLAGIATRLRRFGVEEPGASAAPITAVRATVGGVVTKLEAAPGEVAEPSQELFTVVDLSRVYVVGQVYEQNLGQVRVGQSAAVTTNAYPGERFTGRVVSVGNTVDPETRTAPVRVEVANSGARLKLDQFANVQLATAARRAALAVPAEAVQQVEGRSVVFVRRGAAEFVARPVETGTQTGNQVEITSGLQPGEQVVVSGAFRVKSALQAAELSEEGHDD